MPIFQHRRTWIIGLIAVAVVSLAIMLRFGVELGADIALPEPLKRYLLPDKVPEFVAVSNGRLEATEVDVAVKFSGRLTEVLPQEGDKVEAGVEVARLDTASLEAQLRQARAELKRAQRDREYTLAIVSQHESEREYADRELQRLLELKQRNYTAEDQVDQSRTRARSALAALRASRIKVAETEAAIEAAQAQIDRIATDIEESVLKAPRRGRVLYRLAEPGEVLAAGGKVLTLLDLSDVFMVFFLPETVAGRVGIGNAVRIVFDAAPEYVIPARISFVASQAQFTPKQVETRSERERLVFRAKAQIDTALLDRYEPLVKTGLPGTAYITLDPEAAWPEWLDVRLPPWPEPQANSPD